MNSLMFKIRQVLFALYILCPVAVFAADIEQFVGTYEGEAQFVFDGETKKRDMSTTITATKKGFELSWTSVTYKGDGRTKAKTYTVEFIPSNRDNIYKSAMKTNVFGKATPLDPLQGEPFVWARFEGDTLSLFSLFINAHGEYELQEFHRTLVEGGLDLVFRLVHKGTSEKEIITTLKRVK